MHVVGESDLFTQKVYLNPEKEAEIGVRMGSNMILNIINHSDIL